LLDLQATLFHGISGKLLHYGCYCNTHQAGHVLTDSVQLENRGKALALQAYARQAKGYAMEIMAAVIRVWSERRAGELLEEMKKNGERDAGKGGDRKSLSRDKIVKLPDLGITFNQSSRWKNISHESVNMSQTHART
jgi:hypothetical protein